MHTIRLELKQQFICKNKYEFRIIGLPCIVEFVFVVSAVILSLSKNAIDKIDAPFFLRVDLLRPGNGHWQITWRKVHTKETKNTQIHRAHEQWTKQEKRQWNNAGHSNTK